MAERASRFGGSIGPPEPLVEKSRRGWGGCSGSGIAPNSNEPMPSVSSCKGAGDGRKRGDFVFGAISSRRGVLNTVFGHAAALNMPRTHWRFPDRGVTFPR